MLTAVPTPATLDDEQPTCESCCAQPATVVVTYPQTCFWLCHGCAHTRTCPHTPACPAEDAPDREAAHTIATHPEQGWSLLCNGVVLFDDTGELLPNGEVIAPHRPTDVHPEAFGVEEGSGT